MPYKKIQKKLDMKSGCGGGPISVRLEYSDGFFVKSAEAENPELAVVSAALSAVIYLGEVHIGDALFDFGFKVGCNRNYSPAAKESNTVAFTIGYKKARIGGREVNLIIVVIRGTVGGEWYSNYNIGTGGDNSFHEGFLQAGTDVMSELLRFYLRNELGREETKFWIMGHSRGAAVANYVAGKLTQTGLCARPENIYAYTFATPTVARMTEDGRPSRLPEYKNIRNYLYSGDIITKIPPEGFLWGYSRFGLDISLDSSSQDMLYVKEIFAKYTGMECEPLNMAAAGSFIRLLKTLVPAPALAGTAFFRGFADFIAGVQSGDAPPVSDDPLIAALIERGTELSTRGINHAHSCALYVSWMLLRAENAAKAKTSAKKGIKAAKNGAGLKA